MIQEIQLRLPPEDAASPEQVKHYAADALGISKGRINHIRTLRRSIDARQRLLWIQLVLRVYTDQDDIEPLSPREYPDVSSAPRVIIIGSGPAGMFAALRLIEMGIKPIILERGKDVAARRRDIRAINQEHRVNPESNYCFGEGGAGTYSDGKLYTRSKKRGNTDGILQKLAQHGAPCDILEDAHPHIGTNRLPQVVAAIRKTILESGGEYHFNCKVTDFVLDGNRIKGVITENGDKIEASAVILATGHSARDIYKLLQNRNIGLEQKTFAVGVRIEHPQEVIDRMQYGQQGRTPWLPAAAYNLVAQSGGRGVYSFCMCPGGFIVPSATGPQQVVVNGMSPSKRDNRFANSGIVVEVRPEDLTAYSAHGVLAGIAFQNELEKRAWEAGGQTQTAPAQVMTDFCEKKTSVPLNPTSYQPGIREASLDMVLGIHVASRLREGLREFGRKKNGFYTREANLIGVESRTSSPVRIPRDPATLMHPQIEGLYPCGEGAGYAGGIVSAAVDGENCAEALRSRFL